MEGLHRRAVAGVSRESELPRDSEVTARMNHGTCVQPRSSGEVNQRKSLKKCMRIGRIRCPLRHPPLLELADDPLDDLGDVLGVDRAFHFAAAGGFARKTFGGEEAL